MRTRSNQRRPRKPGSIHLQHEIDAGRVCLDHAPDFLKSGDPSGEGNIVKAKQDDAEGREAISKYQVAEVFVGGKDQALLGLAERKPARIRIADSEFRRRRPYSPKGFRGELVPTEADLARQEGRDYEPAAVLLERIRGAGGGPVK